MDEWKDAGAAEADEGFTIGAENPFAEYMAPDDAEVLYFRVHTMGQLEVLIRYHGWTQTEAAQRLGVPQPRISDLLRGKRENFSVELLMRMAARAGIVVRLRLPEGMPDSLPDGWPQGVVPVSRRTAARKVAAKKAPARTVAPRRRASGAAVPA